MANDDRKLDRERLLKLLNMTTSSHDAEALSAVRRSNELLKAAGTDWSEVLAEPNVQAETVRRSKSSHDPPSDDSTDDEATMRPEATGARRADIFGADGAFQAAKPVPDARVVKARAAIRKVPLLLRIVLFPVWIGAEAYAVVCAPEQERNAWWMGLFASIGLAFLSIVFAMMVTKKLAGLVWPT